MNKNKLKFILYILIFCITLTASSFFYLGTFFADNVTYIKVDNKNEETTELENDPKIQMITKDLNKLVKLLNDNHLILSVGENLNKVAPLVMENVYGKNYKMEMINNENYKIMSPTEYKDFREYFNVTLDDVSTESYFGKGYKLAYKIDESKSDNTIFYDFGYPKLNGNVYESNIQIINKENLINKGIIKVSIVNNHIYYLSFMLFA